jgi:AcrR family transcriptional regulator
MAQQTKGDKTHNCIRQAIVRLEKGRPKVVTRTRKVSIAAAADEAGVSRALITNNYPDLAERIREYNRKAARQQRDKKQQHLQAERAKNRALRAERDELRAKVDTLASKNATLTHENAELRALLNAGNVRQLGRK